MLSMNRSTSSLGVAEILRHRQRGEGDALARAGGRSSARNEGGLVEHARFLHLDPQVVPSRCARRPAEDRVAAVVGGDVVISSMMTTVLPTPAPRRVRSCPFEYGSRRSMTLMPVSNISFFVLSVSNSGDGGGSGVLLRLDRGRLSIPFPMTLIRRRACSDPRAR